MLALKTGKYRGQRLFLSEKRERIVKTKCSFNGCFSSSNLPVLKSEIDKGIDAYLRIMES